MTSAVPEARDPIYNRLMNELVLTDSHLARELVNMGERLDALTQKVMPVLSKLPELKSLKLNPEQQKTFVQRLWARLYGTIHFSDSFPAFFQKSRL